MSPSVQPGNRRLLLFALAASIAATVFAVIYALGPAVLDRTDHSWTPDAEAESGTSTSLILVAGTPDALTVTEPCRTPGSHDRLTLFTSTPGEGLELRAEGIELAVIVNNRKIVSVIWRESASDIPCSMNVAFAEYTWTISDGNGNVLARQRSTAPIVTQLRVEGSRDLMAGLQVNVRTQPHGSSPSGRQWFAGVASVVLAIVAISIALRSASRKDSKRHQRFVRRGSPMIRVTVVDGVVVAVVLLWMFVGPAFWDDWWVVLRHRSYDEVGRFTNYFTAGGAAMPFGYWLDWITHWWTVAVRAPIYLRFLPAGAALLTWSLVRFVFGLIAPMASRRTIVHITLASAFLAGFTAWMMTLRHEPVIAVLVVATMGGVAMFQRRRNATFLALASVTAGLAILAHPAGIVALAPLLVAIPTIEQWLRASRQRVLVLAALVLSIGSVMAVLFFVDSDLGLWLSSREVFRGGHHGLGITDEYLRYADLATAHAGSGTLIRRLSVVIGGLTIAMFLLRTAKSSFSVRNLPGWSLTVAPVLLAMTPSKWVWHFGALVGLAAVAFATESDQRLRHRFFGWKEVVLAVVAIVGVAWAWGGILWWNPYDLISTVWQDLPFRSAPDWMWLVLFLAVTGIHLTPRLRRATTAPIPLVTFIAVTTGLFLAYTFGAIIVDAIKTPGWTFARQNVQSLFQPTACGLADYTVAIDNPTVNRLQPLFGIDSTSADRAAEAAGFGGGAGFGFGWYIQPSGTDDVPGQLGLDMFGSWRPPFGSDIDYIGTFRSVWYAVPPGLDAIDLIIVEGQHEAGLRLAIQTATLNETMQVTGDPIEVLLHPQRLSQRTVHVNVPEGTTAVRILADDAAEGWLGAFAVSEPISITGPDSNPGDQRLSDATRTFVPPELGMYFPCVTHPSIALGIAELPDSIVGGLMPDGVFGPAFDQRNYEWTNSRPIEMLVDRGESIHES